MNTFLVKKSFRWVECCAMNPSLLVKRKKNNYIIFDFLTRRNFEIQTLSSWLSLSSSIFDCMVENPKQSPRQASVTSQAVTHRCLKSRPTNFNWHNPSRQKYLIKDACHLCKAPWRFELPSTESQTSSRTPGLEREREAQMLWFNNVSVLVGLGSYLVFALFSSLSISKPSIFFQSK